MSGVWKKENPPTIDTWLNHKELDMRHFEGNGAQHGQLFLKEDRTYAAQQVRGMIEMQLLGQIQNKIASIESSVATTRKGIKNKFMQVFKKQERGENDGLKVGFTMLKVELELRNLTDLAFVS